MDEGEVSEDPFRDIMREVSLVALKAEEEAIIQEVLQIANRSSFRKIKQRSIKRLFQALKLGLDRTAACKLAKISTDSLRNYEKAIPQLRELTEYAEALCEEEYLKQVRKAAHEGQWTAAAWFLERTNAPRYGRRGIVHPSSGASGIKVEVIYTEEGLGVRVEGPQQDRLLEIE